MSVERMNGIYWWYTVENNGRLGGFGWCAYLKPYKEVFAISSRQGTGF